MIPFDLVTPALANSKYEKLSGLNVPLNEVSGI
jgi:hypothetical protein